MSVMTDSGRLLMWGDANSYQLTPEGITYMPIDPIYAASGRVKGQGSLRMGNKGA